MANQTIMKNNTDYLTMSEIDKMLHYAYNKGNIRDYMLIKLLSRTGRRVTEITGRKPYTKIHGVRPCDIRPDGYIEWCILKKNPIRKKTRSGAKRSEEVMNEMRIKKEPKKVLKPIDDYTLSELQLFIEDFKITPHSRIFPITDRRVRYIISNIGKKCNIVRPDKLIHPHNFRHSFAINYLKANNTNPAALLHVKDLLDHSKLETTSVYLQFTQEDKKKALNKTFGVDE